jgi:hypothetical protein
MLGDVLSDAFEGTLGEENTHIASKLGVLVVVLV